MARVTNHRYKTILRGLAVFMLLLMAFLVLAVSFVSYTASASLFFGALFAWLALIYIGTDKQVCLSSFNKLVSIFINLTNYLYRHPFRVRLYLLLYLIVCIIFFDGGSHNLIVEHKESLELAKPYFDYYKLVITPKYSNLEKLTFQEELFEENLDLVREWEKEIIEIKEALSKEIEGYIIKNQSLKEELGFNIFNHQKNQSLKEELDFNIFNHQNQKNTISASKKGLSHSSDIGLIVKQLEIKSFNSNKKSIINVSLSNGEQWKGKLCTYNCPESIVELVDFPKGSLYSIKNEKGDSLEVVDEYLDQETLKWSVHNLEKGIKFAYIKPPFHKIRRFIQPLLKLSETNKIFLFLAGTVATVSFKFITTPIISIKNVATAKSSSNSENLNYLKGDTNMSDNRTINMGDGSKYNERIEGDYIEGNYYAAGEKQTLADAAKEIQQLLQQLQQDNPSNNTSAQMIVAAQAIEQIESNPTLKQKVISAVKEGGFGCL